MTTHFLSNIQLLEAESIHILREVAANFNNPILLYSIGKDSSVLLRLAQKAFRPASLPFSLLHVDTKWKFCEMIDFRDRLADTLQEDLLVWINLQGEKKKIDPFSDTAGLHTQVMKTDALKQALDHYKFDAIIGGSRRDEEKSRAKERIFSLRNKHHQWSPPNQRPEPWNLYNSQINQRESIRVFPLSNWTESDIWQYIDKEKIPVVPLYFADERPVVTRNNQLIHVNDERFILREDEKIEIKTVRFRTLGCYPLTGAIESEAKTPIEILKEMEGLNFSERQNRIIDKVGQFSMEDMKKDGYF